MSKRYVGKDILKVDAESKVTGRAQYPSDLKFDNCLHVKIKRATYPHAILKDLDISRAKKNRWCSRYYNCKRLSQS